MGSISTSGTTYAESYIEGPMPAGPWTYCCWAKAGGSSKSATGVLGMLLGDYSIRPTFNMRNSGPDIRYGTFDSSVGVLSSIDTDDNAWAFYVISSDGGTSDVRFTVVLDSGGGTWSIAETHSVDAATLGFTDSDAVYLFLGTIGGLPGAHEPLLLTSIKIYRRNLYSSGAGSGADIISQARTRSTLFPSDIFAGWQWDGSTLSGLNVADSGSHTFETWVSTGVATSVDEPSFPGDGPVLSADNAAIFASLF